MLQLVMSSDGLFSERFPLAPKRPPTRMDGDGARAVDYPAHISPVPFVFPSEADRAAFNRRIVSEPLFTTNYNAWLEYDNGVEVIPSQQRFHRPHYLEAVPVPKSFTHPSLD